MMKRELSRREKSLIYILCCVVVLSLLLIVLILPGLTRLQDVKSDRSEAEARRTETETVIKNQAANEAVLEELENQAKDKTSSYYAPMDPEEADSLVSAMIVRYGFTPTSLEMEPLTQATIEPYDPSGENEVFSGSSGEEEAEEGSTLQSYHLTINGEGTSNQVAGLVSEICLNPSMHLVSFSNDIVITEEEKYDDAGILTSTETVTTYTVTITLELFTYEAYEPKSGDGSSDDNDNNDNSNGLTQMPEINGGVDSNTDTSAAPDTDNDANSGTGTENNDAAAEDNVQDNSTNAVSNEVV
ncbi:MAG: hypothetical protein Q4C00_01925 [Bacillota bacterium]|nr:hypothetical protein [Bacillota bacterium]